MCFSIIICSYLVHFSAHPQKINKSFPRKFLILWEQWNFLTLILKNFLHFTKRESRKNFLYFLKRSFSYMSGNGNPQKISCIFSKESFCYISGKGNPETFFVFRETELSYISGGTSIAPEIKISYISPKEVMNKFSKKHFKTILTLFLIILLTLSQIVIYLSKSFLSFILKCIHFVLSEYLLYILISGKNIYKGLISLLFL